MVYLYKIINLRPLQGGQYDYKGLNIDLIISKYLAYPYDLEIYNWCLVGTTEDFPSTNEIIKLTEEEYLKEKASIEKLNGDYKISNSEEPTIYDRVEKLENDITILQNNSIEQKYNELMKGVQ